MNRYIFALICLFIINVNCTMAPQKVDLAAVKFDENAETLLKGIPVEKVNGEHGIVHYKVKDKSKITYAGANMEFAIKVGAQNNIVSSIYAETEKTAATNLVLKSLIAHYKQPTAKLQDNGDTRAYYWQTPTLFIRFMSSEVTSPKDGKQVSSFVSIATLSALKNGVEPDLVNAQKFLQSNKQSK